MGEPGRGRDKDWRGGTGCAGILLARGASWPTGNRRSQGSKRRIRSFGTASRSLGTASRSFGMAKPSMGWHSDTWILRSEPSGRLEHTSDWQDEALGREGEASKRQSENAERGFLISDQPLKLRNGRSKLRNGKSKLRNGKSKLRNDRSKLRNGRSKLRNVNPKLRNYFFGKIWPEKGKPRDRRLKEAETRDISHETRFQRSDRSSKECLNGRAFIL